MSDPSNKDPELEAYLRGDSALSKAYKEDARERPPAHLDAQILAEAHRADAGSRVRPARSPFSGGWRVPASITAVVVLAVSVVVLLPEGPPDYERQRDRFEDAATPEDESTAAGKLQQRESSQAPTAEFAPAPPEALKSVGETSGPAAAPATSTMAPADQTAPVLEQRSAQPKEQQPAPATATVPPDSKQSGNSIPKRSQVQSGAATAAEEGMSGRLKSEAVSEADAWIARIEILIERGEIDAARESLLEFRQAYPQAAVPQWIVESLAGSGN